LVIAPWRRLSSLVYSLGAIPRNPGSSSGCAKRANSPISAHNPAADSVSMPRKQRNPGTVAA
jgi:hypothetical protein